MTITEDAANQDDLHDKGGVKRKFKMNQKDSTQIANPGSLESTMHI